MKGIVLAGSESVEPKLSALNYPHNEIDHFLNEGVYSWYKLTKMILVYSGHTDYKV